MRRRMRGPHLCELCLDQLLVSGREVDDGLPVPELAVLGATEEHWGEDGSDLHEFGVK